MYFIEFIAALALGMTVTAAVLTAEAIITSRKIKKLEPVESEGITNGFITRQEIAEYTRALNIPDITVIERPHHPLSPTTLKYKNKAYAMLYGTDKGVLMTVKITDGYADELMRRYPEVCRAGFPKTPNWYRIPVGYMFKSKDEVYRILFEARDFVGINFKERGRTKRPAA
ncbi:MAG: MmcQ/YjbR family DNA-binding protein [Firmicutes bacterium]|nr:MmcQ/YjbR family DNA-binding protein [Bacillota bacterium]